MHQSPARHTDPQLKPLLSAIRALLPIHSLKNWSHIYMGLSLSMNAATLPVLADNAPALPIPIPISTEPKNNQQQVQVKSAIAVSFNQSVYPGAGYFIISNGQGDTRRISGLDANRISIKASNTLFIQPIPSLAANSTYTVSMENGALTNDLNQPFPAIGAASGLHFTTAPSDVMPPNPVSVTPIHQAIEISPQESINAIFNEAIKAGIGFITLENGQGDLHRIAVDDSNQVSFSTSPNNPARITIRPKKTLLKNSQYSVLVDQGAITDLAGNPFAGVQDKNTYTFKTVVDKTPPKLAANNTIQSGNSGLTLSFNEGIQAGSGSIILIDDQGGKRSFAIHDSKQVHLNNPGTPSVNPTVEIRPEGGLLAGSRYSVQLADGVLTDQAGNSFAGIQDNSLSFITPTAPQDKTPPHPIKTIPSPNQQQVLVSSNIEVHFDEAVKLSSAGAFVLSNGQGDTRNIAIKDSVSYAGSGKYTDTSKVVINLSKDLLANSHYTIQMPADTVTDNAGNPAAAAALSFSTAADASAPVALNTNPTNYSQEVPLDTPITIQFNEAIKAGSGGISLNSLNQYLYIDINDSSQVTFQGNSIIIHPKQVLQANSQYSILIFGTPITDLTGNPFGSLKNATIPSELTFSTITVKTTPIPIPIPLTLHSMSTILNRDGRTLINGEVLLAFNVPFNFGSGYLTLNSDQGDTRRIDVNDNTQVRLESGRLRLLPNKNLLPNAHYSLQVDPGAITDTNGNPFAGVQDASMLNFMTAASAPPVLQQFSLSNPTVYTSPGAHSFPHPTSSNIHLDFDNAIKLGSGNITLSNGQGDTRRIAIADPKQITLSTGSNFSASKAEQFPVNNRLNIKPEQALLSNSRYSVQIDAGAITDLTGLPFGGIQDSNTISFATGDAIPEAAVNNPLQEINRGGTAGVYDNNDMVVFNFNVPVTWANGFSLSKHSFGGNDVIFSPDGRSAAVLLNAASTLVHGDSVTFSIYDLAGSQWSVDFTL